MSAAAPPIITDDKSPICIPFILSRLREHQRQHQHQQQQAAATVSDPGTSSDNTNDSGPRPFIIGLNGVQGVGKTTLVRALADTLRRDEGLETLVCSIDDFYLRREDQAALARAHPDNRLVQVRGQPGTHDLPLAQSFFAALLAGEPARAPAYDKAAHGGLGDRAPERAWPAAANRPGRPRVQVVILEGWCVGFRALGSAADVAARRAGGTASLRRHGLDHLLFVNERLRGYDGITRLFDAFVHVDAEDLACVYEWRLEQEAALRRDRGAGMTDEQVVAFVDAYWPAYELFTDGLRAGLFAGRKPGCHLRLVVGRDRRVKRTIII